MLTKFFKLVMVPAILVIAGCDDPDVQAKVMSAMTYGVVAGRVECHVSTSTIGSPIGGPGQAEPSLRQFNIRETRILDGSCMLNVDDGSITSPEEVPTWFGRSENKCVTPIVLKNNPLGYAPSYDPDTDITKLTVSDVSLTIEYCDNGISGCVTVPHAAIGADDCSGFNLSVF